MILQKNEEYLQIAGLIKNDNFNNSMNLTMSWIYLKIENLSIREQ